MFTDDQPGTPSGQPNASVEYEVTDEDLPVHCPMPGASLWNSHPRVYIPVEATGEAHCAYCGALFRLAKTGSGQAG